MKAIHEKQINEKFAQANNLSIDEMNAQAKEVFATLPEVDPVTGREMDEDARWARAYRRVRGAFRKKARSMGDAKDGMIVCRMTNRDFDRKQYDYAMRVLNKDGLDTAISQGLVNKEGNPIYRWGNNQGKEILGKDDNPGRPQVSGRAIGYTFVKNDEGGYESIEPRYIIISKNRADNYIPVCQVGKLALSITDDKQKGFKISDNYSAYYNDASISNVVKAPYNYDQVQDILFQWNEAFGDNFEVISNVNKLEEFQKEHSYSKDNKDKEYDFCVIPGIVSAISPGDKYQNDVVTIEFVDYETLETSIVTIFMPKELLQGLAIAEDDQGIFVLQSSSYINKEDKEVYQWHLGGFLPVDDDVMVEEFFGVDMGEEDV